MKNLLIVESPGKIKKIKAILGSGWEVKASFGHIRQLSNEGTDSLGFSFSDDSIDCHYAPRDDRAKQTIAGLVAAAKGADAVYLASDPDREGETIAWHLAQVLKLKHPQRVVYQEITEAAVKKAIANPRAIDLDLVAGGRCRDCLDKLVGYKGSPLIWRLNNGAKSVGRVQSATLHLLCDREREILAFKPQDYWSVSVDYVEGFRAFYSGAVEVEVEADELELTRGAESTRVLSQAEAERLVTIANNSTHQVISIDGKVTSKSPPAPFTTSSLQQFAGARLKFSPDRTMTVAQKLYEAGLITYMRTDSVSLSEDFCAAARGWLLSNDKDNVPDRVASQKNALTAQAAHEAIRPTDVTTSSAALKQQLTDEQFDLYLLIWMRSLASQCKPAQIRKTTIVTQSADLRWQAKGQTVEFAGYSKYWQDISADALLPSLTQAQPLAVGGINADAKQTQPPTRYSEPKLVQVMERKGIGRPSTYASTIATLKERNYINLLKDKAQPTKMGLEVDDFLVRTLPDLVRSEFTAQMESQLDAIAKGNLEWQGYLIGWHRDYFAPALLKAGEGLPVASQNRQLEKSRTKCPRCEIALAKVPSKKVAKGYFLKCEECKLEDGKDLVLFWSERVSEWQLPQIKNADVPVSKLTNYPCPVCKQKLEEYSYQKEGESKSMLRCSDKAARAQAKHKGVAYFANREGGWWSKEFGNLG
ncbi:type I DNA topoisomerase [Chamaesiphon sp.]|uniref:type I DNA topoisomerase n=1 Tax=Chamaesiphon sp. TaxID=2814140 RepID=UPI0035949326